MGNRKQPFGYKIEHGQITIHSQEAAVVRTVFESFRTGASFQEIAEQLNAQAIQYDEGRRWNKNAVARVLADERYTGDKDYPVLIRKDIFDNIQQKRAAKQCPVQKTDAQKTLRQLCGRPVTLQIEQVVLALLNTLIQHPEYIQCPAKPLRYPAEINRAQAALDAEMAKQPVDEPSARQAVLTLAAAQYAAIGPEEYETQRLRRLFENGTPMHQLDAEVLRSVVKAIQITGRSTVRVQLKNGQEFGA